LAACLLIPALAIAPAFADSPAFAGSTAFDDLIDGIADSHTNAIRTTANDGFASNDVTTISGNDMSASGAVSNASDIPQARDASSLFAAASGVISPGFVFLRGLS